MNFVKKIGLSGIKLHTVGAKFSLLKQENQERLAKIFNKAGELQFPVLIHSSFPSEEEARVLIRVAAASKDTNFIFAHMLGRYWRLMTQRIPNIYVDISGAVIMFRKSSKEVVDFWRTIGIDKVIFGSDWPVFHPAETIWALKQYPLTNEELDQILNSNAKPLFNH